MSLIVTGRAIQNPGQLSEPARLVLACIDGGVQWLQWAVTAPTARYEFPDETLLLAGVQQGLHGNPLLLVPRLELTVSPLKLMTLSVGELRALAQAESGDADAASTAQARRVLADRGLLVSAELAAAREFLAALEVAAAPVFQSMDFTDHLALYDLLQQSRSSTSQTHALQLEAARFGVWQSRTAAEFIDYYQSFLDYITKASVAGASVEQRAAQAETALHTLLPLLFGALDCPQVPTPATPSDVAQAVRAWTMRGRQVGFARLSSGVLQIIRHTEFGTADANPARALVERYVATAQSCIVTTQPPAAQMGQDGTTCLYTLQSGSQRAQLQLGAGGVISLRSFEASSATTRSDSQPNPESTRGRE